MSRLIFAVVVLLSSGCVVGDAERWQRTRDAREETRVRSQEVAALAQPGAQALRVTALERTQTEQRTQRTYAKMREAYRVGGDLDEFVYALAWGLSYCTGVGLVYDVVSTFTDAGKHAFPGLRTIALGLLPGVHDATLRGLLEDHRITDEVATGETVERPDAPWKPVGEPAWSPLAGRVLQLWCGERLVQVAQTSPAGEARFGLRCATARRSSVNRCGACRLSLEGSDVALVESPLWSAQSLLGSR